MTFATMLTYGTLAPDVALDNADRTSCTAMAQDLFLSVFAHDPHNRDTWDKYRRGILEYGGREQNLLGMLEGFLERPPNMNSLVEGIARAQSQS